MALEGRTGVSTSVAVSEEDVSLDTSHFPIAFGDREGKETFGRNLVKQKLLG